MMRAISRHGLAHTVFRSNGYMPSTPNKTNIGNNIMKNIFTKMINKLLGLFKPVSTIELDFNNHDYKEYYETGQLKRENPIVRGKRHGIEKEYYKNGKLLSEIPYVKGKKHGIEKEYYINGQLLSEIQYVRDEKHGICKTYLYSNGHLLKEEMWVKGRQV